MADLIDRSALGIDYANPLVFDKPEFAHGWNSVIEIIEKAPTVDALIPPCKPWDKVWVIDKTLDSVEGKLTNTICEAEIIKLSYNGFTTPMEWLDYRWDSPLVGQTVRHDRIDLCVGKTLFFTREEAEKALGERRANEQTD